MNWIVVFVLLFPSLALAQDGSMPPQDGGSVPAEEKPPVEEPLPPSDPVAPVIPETPATSTAPTESSQDQTAPSSSTSPTSSPTTTATPSGNGAVPTPANPANVSVPQPGATAPSALMPTPEVSTSTLLTPPDEDTNPLLLPIIALLAVIPFGFLVAGAMKKKKVKKADDEGGRCFDLKTMLDEKLKELTDLKGKLKSKAVGVAKETLRESVEGTATGEMLAAVEKAEKEYARIRKLYEECMIEWDGSKRAVIVHGCPSGQEDGAYAKHWMPWTKRVLEERGVPTELPQMSMPWAPDYETFKKTFETLKVNENTILIGHSCGCAFLVRWLGETKQKVAKLILVAPWKVGEAGDKAREAFYTYDIDPTIKNRVKDIVMFTSDDEEEDGKKSLKTFHDALGGKIVELKGRGHYTQGDMRTEEFPELLAEVK
jgi:uncharacterized protein